MKNQSKNKILKVAMEFDKAVERRDINKILSAFCNDCIA